MSKLYEITAELRTLIEQLCEPAPEPDVPPEVHAAWGQAQADASFALAQCQVELTDKLRAYVAVANELHVEREARAAKIEAIERTVLEPLRRQNDRDARKQQWLIESAENVIKQFNVPMPLKCAEFTITLRKQPPRCMVLDANAIPMEYRRIVPATSEPDKQKILADLKQGVCIPGAAMAATSYKLAVR